LRITLLTVGKTDIKWVSEGLEVYSSRLRHYIPFDIKEIPELKNVSALSRDQIKTQEGKLILKSVKDSDLLILLDERGREFRSVEFADFLQKKFSQGRDIVFVIGGSYGFSPEVYDRAESMLSLSKMTFSHQMVRTIFVEQLYRALTIMKGESYHHE
jgi:23S rRNA (pseudouridine1915-N3)-methyltransferase